MDNSSSERSPSYTDSSPGSFSQVWGSEISSPPQKKPSYPLFGLDHVKEIEGLVEDKDVASQAVAFVVNGTRKGVVRLCADVACLMRVKKRLEHTVEKQRRELEHLRSLHNLSISTRTSRSTSPTHPSITSDETNLQKISTDQSLCSRCSPASSYVSSTHLSQSLDQSLASLHSNEPTDVLHSHQQVITADVHPVPGNTVEKEQMINDSSSLIDDQDDDDDDDSDPLTIVDSGHEQPLRAECNLQTKLEKDLENAKKEIQELQLQLKTKPEHNKPSEVYPKIACDISCEMNVVDETRKSCSSASSSSVSLPHINKTNSPSNLLLVTETSSDLEHSCTCVCAKCTEFEDKNDEQTNSVVNESFALEHRSSHCKGHSVPVQLNDKVVIRGGRIGHIRYIGPINHGNSNMKTSTYLGLQLEEPHGHHDGIHNGKRYFWCHRNHGIFIPLQDVLSVIKAKTSRPHRVRSSSSSRHSVDSSSKIPITSKQGRVGHHNRVAPARLPTPPTTAKPKREFLAGT